MIIYLSSQFYYTQNWAKLKSEQINIYFSLNFYTKTTLFWFLQNKPHGIAQNTQYKAFPAAEINQCVSPSSILAASCSSPRGTPSRQLVAQWSKLKRKPNNTIIKIMTTAARRPLDIIILKKGGKSPLFIYCR